MPASPWTSCNTAPGKYGLVGRSPPFRTLWTLNQSPCLGPWTLSLLCRSALLRRASRLFPSWTVSSLWRVLLSVLSRFLCSVLELGHVTRGVPPPPGRAAVPPSPLWKPRLRMALRPSGSCGPDPCHGTCLSSRAPPPSLALPLSSAQDRTRSSSWLHPAQPAWLHRSLRQELSCDPA